MLMLIVFVHAVFVHAILTLTPRALLVWGSLCTPNPPEQLLVWGSLCMQY